nr:hypothetical protein [Fredinandcohnia onubensis]
MLVEPIGLFRAVDHTFAVGSYCPLMRDKEYDDFFGKRSDCNQVRYIPSLGLEIGFVRYMMI